MLLHQNPLGDDFLGWFTITQYSTDVALLHPMYSNKSRSKVKLHELLVTYFGTESSTFFPCAISNHQMQLQLLYSSCFSPWKQNLKRGLKSR